MSEFYEKMMALAEAEKNMPAKRYLNDVEHQTQVNCVTWFRLQYPKYEKLLFAVPNGGGRSKRTAGKLKAEGVVRGVSDLLMLVPAGKYHGLCIEMKKEEVTYNERGRKTVKRGYQEPEQKEWQALVEKQGYKYVVCWNSEGFQNEVNEYLKEKK